MSNVKVVEIEKSKLVIFEVNTEHNPDSVLKEGAEDKYLRAK